MVSTRTLELLGGLALLLLGGVLAVGSVVAHLAWALPLGELPFRPAMVEGEAMVALGIVLLLVARRHRALRADRVPATAHETSLRLAS